MKRALTIMGAVVTLTASLAATAPSSDADSTPSGSVLITPTFTALGADNECTPDIWMQWRAAANPPIFASNCAGLNDPNIDGMAYLAALVDLANKQGYNTFTCAYSVSNWSSGYTSGNSQWTTDSLFDAYVKGSDDALGVSYSAKTSSATSEVGMYLQAPPNWPTPSSVTVDYRWGGGAYLQADADLSVLAGTGASSATAAYAIDGELWADSARSSLHFYDKAVHANGTHPSMTAHPSVRWDDKSNAVVPTMRVAVQPNMYLTSKIIGSMTDVAEPAPGANASAGVDSWNQGDTYIIGTQHFTFTLPKPYVMRDCGDGNPPY